MFILISVFILGNGSLTVAQTQDEISIVFLHHSCGENLIHEGQVRKRLSELGYSFFDHGYNSDGLCLADGHCPGTHFKVPDDNTDPDGIARIFKQPLQSKPDNTFSYLMQYDVIIFKSCYPVSNIGDDEQLNEYKTHYISIRDRMDQYPEKLFIIVTQPPQVPTSSDPSEAIRARKLADWLSSDEFLDKHPNVSTFDFFDSLAADDNFLRKEYRIDNHDGHPNKRANQVIGPQFVEFIDAAIRNFFTETLLSDSSITVTPVESPDIVDSGDQQPAKGIGNLSCPNYFITMMFVFSVGISITRSKN